MRLAQRRASRRAQLRRKHLEEWMQTRIMLTAALLAAALGTGCESEEPRNREGNVPLPPQVDVSSNSDDLDFRLKSRGTTGPESDYREIAVKVVGPDGYEFERVYPADQAATFSVHGSEGAVLPDGVYKYEAYGLTELMGPSVTGDESDLRDSELDVNGRSSSDPRTVERMNRPEQSITSGSFMIRRGQIVQPEQETNAASPEGLHTEGTTR